MKQNTYKSVTTSSVKKLGVVSGALCLSILVAGCSSTKQPQLTTTRGQSVEQLRPGSPQMSQALGYWSQAYSKDTKDRRAILNYAEVLRANNQSPQAEAVLRRGVIAHSGDPIIASSYGKVLAENGKFKEALNVLENAGDPAKPDWRMMSARAAILDQIGKTSDARSLYKRALQISPNEPSVLNNLGMSYLLAGDLPNAEQTLRKAMQNPASGSRVRQNLSLTVGLQGRFDEALSIATSELNPKQAQANIAYLKTMLGKTS